MTSCEQYANKRHANIPISNGAFRWIAVCFSHKQILWKFATFIHVHSMFLLKPFPDLVLFNIWECDERHIIGVHWVNEPAFVINMQIKLAFETPILNCLKENAWIIDQPLLIWFFIRFFFFIIFVVFLFSESKIIKDKSATISNTTPPPQKVCISY